MGIVLEEIKMLSKAREQLPLFRQSELDPDMHVERLSSTAVLRTKFAQPQRLEKLTSSSFQPTVTPGIRRLALGSVVRHAPCPVLVVREREHEFVKT